MITKKSFPIVGMHCASCASTIKRKVEGLSGVESCDVNYGTEKATVSFDSKKASFEKINDTIKKYGYSLIDGSEMESMDHSAHKGHDMMTPVTTDSVVKEKKLQELAKLKIHVLTIIPMVLISIFVMGWEVLSINLKLISEMPDIVMDFFHHLLPLFATYSLFVIGIPYLRGMVRFFRYKVADMDSLVGIGTSVAFLYSFFVSAFEEFLPTYINPEQNYFDITIVVIGFITLGKYLESKSKLETGEAIQKLMSLQAKNALVLRHGRQMEISIDEVLVGDIVLIKPGTKIPLDGVIVEGSSSIDESMITGESIPVDKMVRDQVIGSTLNKQGFLKIEVTKIEGDTILSKIIKMVEEAQGSKAPIERLADQVSSVFVPAVLVLSVVVFFVWIFVGPIFMPFSQALTLAILSFVGILVIACPCAMGLATPTAVIVGIGKAAENGILIKNAESLEKFSSINYIVMDKTGTLTKGEPEVTDIISDKPEKEILGLMASLENLSEHPLAQAVIKKAKEKKIKLQKVTSFENESGKGLSGKIGSTEYFVGNIKMAKKLGLKIDDEIYSSLTSQGKTPVIFMTKKEILGYIGIADTLRDDAHEAVKSLHKLGVKVAMLTGDNKETAQHIASQVGIDKVIAEVLPSGKAEEIKKLQNEGYKVAMVGDGVNDAPALALSDVGVAMSTGTDVSIESAGITLLGGHLSKLSNAVNLSKSTMRVIKQNLFWAFFYNIIGIPIAAGILYPFFGILLNPAIAGAAMGFSSVSVVVNSLRLKTSKI